MARPPPTVIEIATPGELPPLLLALRGAFIPAAAGLPILVSLPDVALPCVPLFTSRAALNALRPFDPFTATRGVIEVVDPGSLVDLMLLDRGHALIVDLRPAGGSFAGGYVLTASPIGSKAGDC
jgi:hypothetical protein